MAQQHAVMVSVESQSGGVRRGRVRVKCKCTVKRRGSSMTEAAGRPHEGAGRRAQRAAAGTMPVRARGTGWAAGPRGGTARAPSAVEALRPSWGHPTDARRWPTHTQPFNGPSDPPPTKLHAPNNLVWVHTKP
jgi:hypothetical protein